MGASLHNDLEAVCSLPAVFAIKEMMHAHGALGAVMTGSGSAVVGLFAPKTEQDCIAALTPHCTAVFGCRPVEQGVLVLDS